jgi:hypothetical protein
MSWQLSAQTTLAKGDIAIVGWNANSVSGSDQFTFVCWVPLANTTTIKFTNNRWHSAAMSGNSLSASAGSTLNQIVNWTNNTGSTIAAGTVILIQLANTTPTTTVGSVAYNSQSNGSIMNLGNGGQRIFAYQGSDYSSGAGTDPNTFNGTILYGLFYQGVTGASTWLTSGSAGVNNTYLPSELNVSGYNIVMGSNAVGGDYPGSRSSQSSFAAYQALVSNSANYTANVINPNTVTLSTTAFTLATTNYYYDGSGAITTLTNWGTNTDGTGTNPSNFTTAGSTYFIANTTGTINLSANWTVGSSSGTLNIASGIALGINGNTLDITGAIAGTGTIAGSSTSNLTLTGTIGTINFTSGAANRTLHDLTLNATTTATLGTALTITAGSSAGTVTVGSSSTLTTGGNLTLASDINGTARVGNSAGSISGNVTMQRYIPGGKRGLRWLAHPFSTTLNLSDLIDDIDITGSGGATNGFTSTSSTAPSAFWFDVATADNNTNRSNAGWAAFTTANGTGSNNTWTQYEGVSILVRGTPGQGLGTPVTPSAVTLDLTGAVNQGSQVVTVTKGSGSTLAFVANPFPSQIDINLTTRGGGIGSTYYIWDPNSGTKGAFVSKLYSASFIMPSGVAFMTSVSSTSSITFDEADKSSSTPTSTMLKTTGISNGVQLKLTSNSDSITWDQWDMYFDNQATADSEWYDGMKLMNPEISIYSFAKDGAKLAIDSRPYAENEIIPMGLAYATPRTYTLRVEDIDMPVNTQLYLHDKYLNTVVELKQGGSYVFDVTIDSLTYGDNRFELNMLGNPTNSSIAKNKLKVQLVPNPATNNATLYYEGMQDGNIEVNITNMVGIKVATYVQASVKTGSINIPLQQVASGIYIVEVKNGNQTITQKLVKQ